MFNRTLRATACVLLFASVSVRNPIAGAGSPNWLERVNFYRASASLPPVAEDPALSGGVLQHARYMVMNSAIKHSENRWDAGATREGAAAAVVSNLAGSLRSDESDSWAVDLWMQAPFHAIGILDPALAQVGFGIHHAHTGQIMTAAGLDVIRGRRAVPPGVRYPIVWPANGATVPLVAHISEYPSPLTSCPGYAAPAGLPLIVQLGRGKTVPLVTQSWIAEGGHLLEHCVFDESTYRNGDPAQQRLGRRILGSRDAIVLIPRHPLNEGQTYRAVVEVNGRLIDWSFSVG